MMKKIVLSLKPQTKCSQVVDPRQSLLIMNLRISDFDLENQSIVMTTQDAVRKFQEDNSLAVTGIVDEAKANSLNRMPAKCSVINEEVMYVVNGIVHNIDGKPVENLIVEAFDCNLNNNDVLLGQATTDSQGYYSITYTVDKLEGKSTADLVADLYRGDTLLQTTDIIFDAPKETRLDFIISETISPKFQRLSDKIKPLLRDKDLGKLEKNRIGFLKKMPYPAR